MLRNSNARRDFYFEAKSTLIENGYGPEMAWQSSVRFEDVTESTFICEAAWVVYCSGFRESVVRRCFDHISLCFFDWESAQQIASNAADCVASALRVFRNQQKHLAVATIASNIAGKGFEGFKASLGKDPVNGLMALPFLGPITKFHLAKNLGMDVAKPDRHLSALKDLLGFSDVHEMCSRFSDETGDPVNLVDIVLWRLVERIRTEGRGFSGLEPSNCASAGRPLALICNSLGARPSRPSENISSKDRRRQLSSIP
jgi:hypothetical protein